MGTRGILQCGHARSLEFKEQVLARKGGYYGQRVGRCQEVHNQDDKDSNWGEKKSFDFWTLLRKGGGLPRAQKGKKVSPWGGQKGLTEG